MATSPVVDNAYADRHVCVTGGAGFIGSHLCDELLGTGATVTVIDDLSNGSRENLDESTDRLHFIEGSILDQDALNAALRDAEIVFHQAALGSVPASIEHPQDYYHVNCTGTLRVLETARECGGSRVVYAASSSAYGDQPELPKIETMLPAPRSPYASSKLAAEHLMRVWSQCYSLSTISLRYFNIFGARQRPDSPYAAVIPVFARALMEGRKPVIFGSGEQTRDFTHISNVVHANLLAGLSKKPLQGEVLNIGCGGRYSLLELIEVMAHALNAEPHYQLAPPRPGDVMHSEASIAAARETIGYEPLTSFQDGIWQTLNA